MATSLRDRLIGKARTGVGSLGSLAQPAPVAPSRPPSGYYDPTIDETERAGARGLGDLRIDTDTANQRASSAYVTNTTRLGEDRDTSLAGLLRSKTRGVEDVTRSSGRSLADLLRSKTRGGEDFATDTAARRRSYTQLGDAQAEGAQAAGVAGGGALAASLKARLENEGIEQAGAQRSFDRFNEDNTTSVGRVTEDRDTSLGRIGEDYDTGVSGVNRDFQRAYDDEGTGYQYGVDDRALGLGRAEREQVFTGTAAANLRDFQAAAAGYKPPAKKKGKK